jgi:hypothetical protein
MAATTPPFWRLRVLLMSCIFHQRPDYQVKAFPQQTTSLLLLLLLYN